MAFRKTLGAIGTTAVLALSAIGAFSPVASAQDASHAANATIKANKPGSSHSITGTAKPSLVTQDSKAVSATTATAKPAPTDKPESVSCWNGRTSGRYFYETCDGSNYRPYVDCSNGYRYIFGVFNGEWNFTLACPAGTNAEWGGAIG
jgi:hypothetical protein